MSKNLAFKILCTLLVLSFLVLDFIAVNKLALNVSEQSFNFCPTIVIDPGHGGIDSGAVSDNNILEKDINLSISLKLKNFFESNGFIVVLTRDCDVLLATKNSNKSVKRSDLSERVNIFNNSKSNIVLSIHQNKFSDSKYSGTQVFYSDNNTYSETLAKSVQNSVVSLVQPQNTREIKEAGSDIYILENTTVPAVLIECGFLSNKNECEKLATDLYQNELAYCIFLGFLDFYNTNY